MKLSLFKQVIKETVKEAVREVLVEQLEHKQPNTSSLSESKNSIQSKNPLQNILEDTRRSMNSTEVRQLLGESEGVSIDSSYQAPPIDTQPDFIKNAATIFKKSLEKTPKPLD